MSDNVTMKTIQTKIDTIESLFEPYNLHSASLQGRQALSDDAEKKDFVYGEVKLHEIGNALDLLELDQTHTFFDYGSGSGKITFFASQLQLFAKCIGIEMLQTLYETSMLVSENFKNQFPTATPFEFINQSFLDYPLKGKCCIFTNAICFSEDTCEGMTRQFTDLDIGSYILTNKILNLPDSYKEAHYLSSVEASWGSTSLYIHQKVS